MRDIIEAALRGHNADYIELRIEENAATRISYRGRELEDLGRTANRGGNVRALVRGGWGFVSFNALDDLRERVELAVQQARLAGSEESRLAPTEPVVDVVEPFIKKDPRQVPLAEKKRLLDEYNEVLWSQPAAAGKPNIQTSILGYGDAYKKVTFASSEGSYIEQSKVEATFRASAVPRSRWSTAPSATRWPRRATASTAGSWTPSSAPAPTPASSGRDCRHRSPPSSSVAST